MPGVRALRKIQLGVESAKGTAVAATALWRGQGVIEDQTEVMFPEEDIGYLSGIDRSYIPRNLAAITFEQTPATFEQLGYVLDAGVKTVSGVQDGAGSDYTYTYTFPTSAANSIKTYTIEGGDDQQAEEIEFAFVKSFTLAGAAGEAWTVTADWAGRQVSTASFTGSISVPTVEEILFQKGKLYIDAIGGTIGSTQKSSTLLNAELAVTTGWQEYFTADGNLYFTGHKSTKPEVLLTLTFEHDGTSVAEKANWLAETARLIRILVEGSTVSTPGTTYSKKTLIIDLAGKWERFEALDEQDGNDIVTGRFRAAYDPTSASFAEIVVVNELSALP